MCDVERARYDAVFRAFRCTLAFSDLLTDRDIASFEIGVDGDRQPQVLLLVELDLAVAWSRHAYTR